MLILAACALAVTAQPAPTQNKPADKDKPASPAKPAPPEVLGGKTLHQWIERIKDRGDPSMRETAIRTVPFFGKPAAAAIPSLLSILENDRDASCRVHACLSLYALAEHIDDADVPRAVQVLGERVVEDPQAIVRFHAAIALGALGPKAVAAIPSLARKIEDPSSWELRRAIIAALSAIAADEKFGPRDNRAVSAIAGLLLSTENPERSGQVRVEAVMALGEMGRPADDKHYDLAMRALQKSLHDPEKPVQIWAQAALMRLDKATPEKLSALAQNLKVKDANVKFHAARALFALRNYGARAHIRDISDLLDDKDPIVVATAIEVLAGFGSDAKSVVPRLQQLVEQKDQTDYFRQAAREAIRQITGVKPAGGNEAGPAANGGARAKPPEGPPDEIGGKGLKQWVEDIAKSPDPSVRETAIRAVPYFGKPAKAAVAPLIALLKRSDRRYDPDASCRCHACLALSALAGAGLVEDPAEAVRALSDRVDNDPQAIVRYYAVIALGSFGPKAAPAIPSLVNRIHDPNSWELRRAAVSVLGVVAIPEDKSAPDPRAVTAIARLLLSNDGWERSTEVRMEAVMALGGMGRPVGQQEFLLSLHALQKSASTEEPDKGVRVWARVAVMAVENKVTKEGLDDVAGYLGPKNKDALAKVHALRALGAMGKEAKPKIPDIIKAMDDKDAMVSATAIDVLGELGSAAQEAIGPLEKLRDKEGQTGYFKDLIKTAIDNINNPRKR
jgi:HEAT repeat protein